MWNLLVMLDFASSNPPLVAEEFFFFSDTKKEILHKGL